MSPQRKTDRCPATYDYRDVHRRCSKKKGHAGKHSAAAGGGKGVIQWWGMKG